MDNVLRNICNETAMALIASLSGHSVFTQNTKRNFPSVRDDIQNKVNERIDRHGSLEVHIDISCIGLNSRIGNSTLWEWAKRMDKITKHDKREEFFEKFKSEFYETYSLTIFVIDQNKGD